MTGGRLGGESNSGDAGWIKCDANDDSFEVLGIVDKLERMDRTKTLEALGEVIGQQAEAFLSRVEQLIAIRDFKTLSTYFEDRLLDKALLSKARERLEDWQSVLSYLDSSGINEFVQVDLGIVRGLAYYTGFVFEAFEASGKGRALAGGGRVGLFATALFVKTAV